MEEGNKGLQEKGGFRKKRDGAASQTLFHTHCGVHMNEVYQRRWERLTEMYLFYGDTIKSVFRLAVQPSHLSLLLVARRVCCLSLGRQRQQSRLDSQSDGIIQPSIKLCGQQ